MDNSTDLVDPLLEQHLLSLLTLRDEAIACQQRRMVVVTGDLVWCINVANALIDYLEHSTDDTILWISRERPEPSNRLQQIIGGESQLLIFNAHHGFDPNLFGATAGTVTGGGLLLLLTPDFEKWKSKSDPVSSRITVHPHLPESISNRYIERLIRIIEAGEQESRITIIHQARESELDLSKSSDRSPQQVSGNPTFSGRSTLEQHQAIDAIIHTATGHRHRPLVITADRGRGKSAALGIAAARLIHENKGRIVVTAPSRAAVDNLFKHAELPIETGETDKMDTTHPLAFIAPDNLIRGPITAELILVDEAAAIPAPILTKIVERYPRVVFATTTHGYEGSGQGFALRFLETLQRITPNFSEIQLNSPIRWSEGDPVEEQVNQMLMLDAEPDISIIRDPACAGQIDHIKRLDRELLARDESLLRELFGLLVLAHYRTAPLDLRQILDGPNLTIYTATHKNAIVATALVADEGEIEEELVQEIWLGRRRPQGHLLPQTLIAHLGIRDAAPLRYRRIIRIAVHPQLQRRGIGRELIDKISADATTEQIDLIGTSYGATTGLIDFWNQSQLTPLFIGSQRSACSGTYALTQMGAISRRGAPILALAEQRFQNSLLSQLRDPLEQLEGDIIHRLLKPIPFNLDQHDRNDIDAFADGHRRYDTVIPPLTQLLLSHFDKISKLTPRQQQLLILRLLQHRPCSYCIALLDINGKSSLLAEMRSAIAVLRNCL